MKRVKLLFLLSCLVSTGSFGQTYESYFGKVDNDSLYRRSPYHECAYMVLEQGEALPTVRFYSSTPVALGDGRIVYRVSQGSRLSYVNDDSAIRTHVSYGSPGYMVPTDMGYRHADGKMYMYDFGTGDEVVALDFGLSVGDRFTTPDGVEWTVAGRGVREYKTLYDAGDSRPDYTGAHVVLEVVSSDGLMKDEWIENVGPSRHPLHIKDASSVAASRLLYMQYSEGGHVLVPDAGDDPFYCSYVTCMQSDNRDEKSSVSYDAPGASLKFSLWAYYPVQRYACFAFRDGADFHLGYIELQPTRDAGSGDHSIQFSFTGVPASPTGDYNVVLPGQWSAVTGIGATSPCLHPADMSDLHGRRLSTATERGVYIEDGKVRVVR